jgi:hypothetical protein
MRDPIVPTAPPSFLSSLPNEVGQKLVAQLALVGTLQVIVDVCHHPEDAILATASVVTTAAMCALLVSPVGVPFCAATWLGSYVLLRTKPIKGDSQQTEDHKLLTGMFSKKCGGISENPELRERTRNALFRARQDPLYEKYEGQFFQCVHSKI